MSAASRCSRETRFVRRAPPVCAWSRHAEPVAAPRPEEQEEREQARGRLRRARRRFRLPARRRTSAASATARAECSRRRTAAGRRARTRTIPRPAPRPATLTMVAGPGGGDIGDRPRMAEPLRDRAVDPGERRRRRGAVVPAAGLACELLERRRIEARALDADRVDRDGCLARDRDGILERRLARHVASVGQDDQDAADERACAQLSGTLRRSRRRARFPGGRRAVTFRSATSVSIVAVDRPLS